ncbi:PREDICTED: probable sugar phosphate/phosphate translocator At3g11320 isoform X2 [Lupinus angustifolius]|uniref:probable sugar phosphate/phosphate translocator At3g11320 isoform X2 n=1 Tax=Lupinus angustifolius TaxID=3871 RepID=UPI00092FA416|nr:PREDICTED: probable sugar phosphate/phosphate translocator At3g11320 isoform X2 [Lupinus angustifolius]
MASNMFITPATVVVAITGRVKQLREVYVASSSAGTYKVCLPTLLLSKRVERIPWFDGTASSNYSCGGDRSALVKVSEGGAIPFPSGWSQGSENQIEENPVPKIKGSNRFFTIGLVAAWYSSNIGVLLLNKYLLSNYGFKYPIFLTMCHMTACSLFSYVAIAWLKVVPLQSIRSRVQFFKISALSLIFCVSVVFGNVSLRYLPVSFNQAIGATTPFYTAVFAYLMTFKREAWLTYLTLVPVVTGVVIASGGEPSFHLFGFMICVAATGARALKSVLQGILLSSEGEKLNSMNLLLYMAPMAVVFLLPASLIMEENVIGTTMALARDDVKIIWYLLFNSSLAYFVNIANFLVTKHTSALTLQVLGNAKGAVAVVVSILIFRNPVSVTGMMGYALTVCGVVLYSEAKKQSK